MNMHKKTRGSSFPPMVIENGPRGERAYDIYSRLLMDRIIFLGTEIDDDSAASIISQMLYLSLDDPDKDINLYIMSPGGSITSCLAIYDTMQYLPNDVATYCLGQAASAAAVLLLAGSKGKRYALPSSRVMVHQPWGGAMGDARSLSIQVAEINSLKSLIYGIMSKHTDQKVQKIESDCDRDYFMTSEQAKKYGIVDKVLTEWPTRKKPA